MAKMLQKTARFGRAVSWWVQLVLLVLAMVVVWRLMPDDARHEVMREQ
jgi:hypothetical protein